MDSKKVSPKMNTIIIKNGISKGLKKGIIKLKFEKDAKREPKGSQKRIDK